MSGLRFFITDVFATDKYSGNQLATVLHDGRMSSDKMQRVAAEFGFSETTFIMGQEPVEGGYPVRIFTPRAEIEFAGHPTLGTAYVLCQHLIRQPVDRVVLNLLAGQIPVRGSNSNDRVLWMSQLQPTLEHGVDAGTLAAVLGLSQDAIDPRWPISQVTTGLPFTIVPLKNMAALKKARINADQYAAWIPTVWAKGILAFCFDGYTSLQTLATRVFVPYLGIAEDPATGSGSGCLASYLLHHRCLGSDSIDVCVGQGYEIGRPSEIFIRAALSDNVYSIDIGGRVVETASGILAD
jgi:trans-2,3-dihydro-3-hydroxyanthranilate isomerase